MKRLIYFVMTIMLLLPGCAPTTEIPVSTDTVTPSLTSTNTPPPTATERPTETPITPTATITPIEVVPVPASPLTLTEFNVGTEMKRLNVIGTGTAHGIEFSLDGKRLAIATGRGVFLYDGTTFEQNGFIDVNDSVLAIAFSPDGSVLAVAVDGKTSLWNVKSGQHMMNLDGELVSIYKLAYGLGGYVAAMGGTCRGCGSQQLGMILWDTKTGRQIFSQRDIWYATRALAFTSDGKRLFFGGQDGLTIIETETGKQVEFNVSKFGFPSAVNAPGDIIFNVNDTKLFVTSLGETGDLIDIAIQTRQHFDFCDTEMARSNLRGVCPVGDDVVIFDLATGEEIETIEVGTYLDGWNAMLTISPDSRYLAYGLEHFVSIVDTQTGQEVKKLEYTNFDNLTAGIILIDDAEKYVVATLTYSGQVEIYDIQTGELIQKLNLDCCEIKGFNFAPNQKTFATINTNLLRLWDLQTGKVIYEVDLKEDFSGPITFSPDGSSVFLTHVGEDYVLELDLQSGKNIYQGQNSYAYNYADPFAVENYHFNTQGDLVMLGYEKNGDDNYPSFRDVATDEKIILPYSAYSDPLFLEAFSFSSDGKYVAFGNPTDIFVWNIETLKLQSKLSGHDSRGADGWFGKIRSVDFNPQSNLLVSVGRDGTIRLWNARFGNELRRLNICCSVDFTPDGRYLITYGNGVAYVWGIP